VQVHALDPHGHLAAREGLCPPEMASSGLAVGHSRPAVSLKLRAARAAAQGASGGAAPQLSAGVPAP